MVVQARSLNLDTGGGCRAYAPPDSFSEDFPHEHVIVGVGVDTLCTKTYLHKGTCSEVVSNVKRNLVDHTYVCS